MFNIPDRVKVNSTTTGTSDFVLGSAVSGWRGSSALIDGETYDYVWESEDGTGFECGRGVYTATGTTLARTTIFNSSNSDAKVSCPSGTHKVSITVSASKFKDLLLSNLKNAIINGCCRVAEWTNARTLDTTFGFGKCDRWQGACEGTVGAGTLTQAETTLVGETGYALHFSGVTLTGAGKMKFRTRLESDNVRRFRNKKAIMSLHCYHDIGSAKNLTIELRKANAKNDWSATTQIFISGNISIPDSSDILASITGPMGECGNGLEINVVLDTGAITTKNAYFTEMQLIEGDQARSWGHVDYAEELRRCQRFLFKITGIMASGYATASGQTSRCNTTLTLPTALFKNPTIDATNANWSVGLVDSSSFAIGSVSGTNSLGLRMTSNNSGSTYFMMTSGFILLNSEIMA